MLECLLSKALAAEARMQMVGMSATFSHVENICAFLSANFYQGMACAWTPIYVPCARWASPCLFCLSCGSCAVLLHPSIILRFPLRKLLQGMHGFMRALIIPYNPFSRPIHSSVYL